jgi:predicted Zn-dependent protease
MANALLRLLLGGVRAGRGARAGTAGRYGHVGRMALIALVLGVTYLQVQSMTRQDWNPHTMKNQRSLRDLTPQEEISIGLAALPQIRAELGMDHPDTLLQAKIDALGMDLLRKGVDLNPYPFEFTLLGDAKTINAYALPGGQIFITYGLYKLLETDQEIAAVLSHEIGHALARHPTAHFMQRLEKAGIAKGRGVAEGLTETVTSPEASVILKEFLSSRYNSDDEYECDELAVRILAKAG